jgi:hypothetical protein
MYRLYEIRNNGNIEYEYAHDEIELLENLKHYKGKLRVKPLGHGIDLLDAAVNISRRKNETKTSYCRR